MKDEGICPGNVPRFYFDQSASRCLLFSYGGCGGNTNNFLTEESCIGSCGGPRGALIHAIQRHGETVVTWHIRLSNNNLNIISGGIKPRKPICNLPINRGSCQAKLSRFYFDAQDETCKLFVFGGCQGDKECIVSLGHASCGALATIKILAITVKKTV